MESTHEVIQVLIDLVMINRDRVEGYKMVSYKTDHADLKGVFSAMADISRKNVNDLTKEIMHITSNPTVDDMIYAGDIYRSWSSANARFMAETIVINSLQNCESAEKAVLNAYREARENSFNVHVGELITRQEELLKTSYDVIRSYRESYEKVY